MSALDVQDSALLDAVRAIRWPARRAASSGAHGAHLSRMHGLSQEFTEHRAYRPGDDMRRLDWKLLGRTDRAYIRVARERRVLPTVLLVDASASLAYPADTLEKWNHARHVALGLAAATYFGRDPVGLLLASGSAQSGAGSADVKWLPPRTRQGVVREIALTLSGATPAGSIDLAALLARLRHVGRIAVVSDFLSDADGLPAIAGRASAAGTEVYAVHLVHEHEVRPPQSGLLIDPERVELRRTMTGPTRRQYIENFSAWCDRLARAWSAQGAYYTRVMTGEPAARAVRRIALPPRSRP